MENADAKVLKLWYVEETKSGDDYEIKKVSENINDIVSYEPELNKITNKKGKQLDVFRTFKEAAIISLGKKIVKKKEKWNEVIETSYKLNEEIGALLDTLDKLKGVGE